MVAFIDSLHDEWILWVHRNKPAASGASTSELRGEGWTRRKVCQNNNDNLHTDEKYQLVT